MNIFAYNTQDPAYVAAKVGEVIAKELGISSPQYDIEMADEPPKTNAKSIIGDIGRTVFGGKTNELFTLIYRFDDPRSFEIRVNVIRSGAGSAVSYLLYSAPLTKDVDANVSLGEPKMFGAAKFSGGASADKLNASADLVKRANKLARSESSYGTLSLKIQRMFAIFPKGDEPAMLAVGTLARPVSMGMSVSMDLKEFTELAGLIETLL